MNVGRTGDGVEPEVVQFEESAGVWKVEFRKVRLDAS